jgi:alcohol dehydrogenase class IV
MDAMRSRAPDAIGALAGALGTDVDGIGLRIEELGGGPRRLGELGASIDRLDAALDAILARPELGNTPDPPRREEIRRLVGDAW